MTNDKKQIFGHVLACGTQMMWGATFVSTKVLLTNFLPVEVLFTRTVLAFFALLLFYPHRLKLKNPRQELAFAGAGLFGIVLYFMLENTALTMTYASNVGIIVACAPFFVAVIVGIFFKNEKSGMNFYIGFVVSIAGVILISLNGQKTFNLNPLGDGLAFLAMISWGCYSALVKKIGEWDYPIIAVTRRIYFYGILFITLIQYTLKSNLTRSRIVFTGTFTYLIVHFILNVGGVAGLIPLTGVPLLFISSGGTSLLSIMCCLGLAESEIIATRRNEDENNIRKI